MLPELFRPFAYLTIRHPTKRPQLINWLVPIFASALLVTGAWLTGLRIDVFSASGLTAKFLGFVQNLPGFYIAALAAIATFNSPDMLKLMPGRPPTMDIMYNGAHATVELTRRRFLSAMFAFLTASSIIITVISIGALALADPIKGELDPRAYPFLKFVFTFVYLTLIVQLISVTLWGLFYLGERIHTPDA